MLPDLPKLIGQWVTEMVFITTDMAVWVPTGPSDITRWIITFEDLNVSTLLAGTDQAQSIQLGFLIPPGGYREFKYKDYGPIVGQQWFLSGRGAIQVVPVYTASIRLRRADNFAELRKQNDALKDCPELKPLLENLIAKRAVELQGA